MQRFSVSSTCLTRPSTVVIPPEQEPFKIIRQKDQYKRQFAHIYYTRLQLLRPSVLESAHRKWKSLPSKPKHVPRVLEVSKGDICYVVGTIYMEMPLKPNVIDELARDVPFSSLVFASLAEGAPEIKDRFYSPDDKVALEDESGRVRLVGKPLKSAMLVTGVIVGVLGIETPNGELEVIDLCYAGMIPQDSVSLNDSKQMDVDDDQPDEWIAAVSGLDVGGPSTSDGPTQMLADYLVGEGGSPEDQLSSSSISRLYIVGDSIATILEAINADGFAHGTNGVEKKLRPGQETVTFSQMPLRTFTAQLLDIAKSIPVHILPGANDPAGGSMPQQAFPKGMFGPVSQIPSFASETNPARITLETAGKRTTLRREILLHSGQPISDMAKYLPSPPVTRLALVESCLRWRHIAPTAPDTLWCFPYVTEDPFIMTDTPDIFLVGGQPQFGTKMMVEKDPQTKTTRARCRTVLVPSFAKTGLLVLVNLRTLQVKTISFGVSEDLKAAVQDDGEFGKVERLLTPELGGTHDDDMQGVQTR